MWSINEDDEDDLTLKYVGKRVRKQFRVGDVVTTYDDDITHVNFVQDVGQFMMHVSYDMMMIPKIMKSMRLRSIC